MKFSRSIKGTRSQFITFIYSTRIAGYTIYLRCVVDITRAYDLLHGFYLILPVGTTFDTVPHFNTTMNSLFRSVDTYAFEINIYRYFVEFQFRM